MANPIEYTASSENVYNPANMTKWEDETWRTAAHSIVDEYGRGGFLKIRYGKDAGKIIPVTPVLALPATCESGGNPLATCDVCGRWRECQDSGAKRAGLGMWVPLYRCARCLHIDYAQYCERNRQRNNHYDFTVIPLGPGVEQIDFEREGTARDYWNALEQLRIEYTLNLKPHHTSEHSAPLGFDDEPDSVYCAWVNIATAAKRALEAMDKAANLAQLRADYHGVGGDDVPEGGYPFDAPAPRNDEPGRDASYGSLHGNGCGCSQCDRQYYAMPPGYFAGGNMTWAEAVGWDDEGRLMPAVAEWGE